MLNPTSYAFVFGTKEGIGPTSLVMLRQIVLIGFLLQINSTNRTILKQILTWGYFIM